MFSIGLLACQLPHVTLAFVDSRLVLSVALTLTIADAQLDEPNSLTLVSGDQHRRDVAPMQAFVGALVGSRLGELTRAQPHIENEEDTDSELNTDP